MSNATYDEILRGTPAAAGGRPARSARTESRVMLDAEAKDEVGRLLQSGALSTWKGGPIVRRFEEAFAAYHGMPAAVALNSGTSALHCAYVAAGVRAGDEVIIPAACYVSAASSAVQIGARIVVCDIDPETLSIDPAVLESCVTDRTRLIVPVHLWGIPSAMPQVAAIAAARGIAVVEDCAQAHGASLNGRLVGTYGQLSAFSFSPQKLICTGQGGMVLCAAPESAERVRQLASKGKGAGWHDYLEIGYSYVMAEFEAIAGLNGLRNLPATIDATVRSVAIYTEAFAGTDLRVVAPPAGSKPSYFKCPVRLPARYRELRDRLLDAIAAENVAVRLTHPPLGSIGWLAPHLTDGQQAALAAKRLCPVAERELPLTVEIETNLTEEEARRSAAGVLRAFHYICGEA